jgi:predicted CoA-binding protein
MKSFVDHLSWIVPLTLVALSAGYSLWSLMDRVERLEDRSYIQGEKAYKRLRGVEERIHILEITHCKGACD